MITSTLKRMQPNRPHLAVLVVLLVCALVLTGFLAYQGYDANNNQRIQAEQMLREWAQIAAVEWDEFVQRTLSQSIYFAIHPGFAAGAAVEPGLEAASTRFDLVSLCPCLTRADVRTTFSYSFDRDSLRTAGVELSPAVLQWIREGLEQAEPKPVAWGWAAGTLIGTPDGNQRAIFYLVDAGPDGSPGTAVGFETGAYAVARFLDTVWRARPLLLQSVMHGMPNDWILSARVTDGQQRLWYESAGRYPQLYTASHEMANIIHGLTITVAVRPDAAEQLLIGGLPTNRLPTLFVLLALTSGLVLAAIFLIRREADITRLRADFIAGVSHELRTPLAQIRMFAETLMLGRVRSEVERHRSLEIIDQEARRLTHLVENVLLFARAERRSSRINPERIDLAADVRDAIHGFAILCRSKAVEVRPELQEGVSAPVDRGALRQILLNLLDNAVKYGPLAQRVTVGTALFDRAVRVWVDDEGPGIPDVERTRVFDSFVRLDRDLASPVAGSGIGLSIVRELVNLHDGRVWIEDAPGGGARVVVEFPGAYLRPEIAKDDWAVA